MELASDRETGKHSRRNRPPRGIASRVAGLVQRHMNSPVPQPKPLELLSVVIPALNEEGCICSTVEHLTLELRIHGVPNEIIVVDDGSTDSTWSKLQELSE